MSAIIERHGLAHLGQGFPCLLRGRPAAIIDDGSNKIRLLLELPRPFLHGFEFLQNRIDHGLLALDAADPGGATTLLDPGLCLFR